MKLTKKILSVLLAFALVLGSVFVAPAKKADAADQDLRAVFSIDAGRKYFSEEQLIQIIDKAAENGYTDVQILLGNDGLRFVLDDMSISVNGTTYASSAVKSAITAGNNSYYRDPNGDALTETEMDNILAHAKEKGINIIPGINSPGHMDALLVAMEQLGMTNVRYTNGSKPSDRTVSLENDEAVAFVKELVKKYAAYFGEAGASDIFNFGADEYANDVFGNPGWSYLQSLGLYGKFIDYANAMSAIVKAEGMSAMCFNDGIYYNRKDTYGTFDTDIIISYWTSGWSGFNVAPARFLSDKGHRILNTNDRWYWVLGNISSGGYPYDSTITNIALNDFTGVTGDSTNVPIIGSMQCVWCDEPRRAHDMDRIMELMDRFAERHAEYMGGEISGGDSEELSPSDDSRDYPRENCKAFADSQYLPGNEVEGPVGYILDDNTNTYWHTDWTNGPVPLSVQWIGITLDEPTELEALRYLPRTTGGGNGLVLDYKVQYRAAETDAWTDISVGSWSQTAVGWRLAQFDHPVVAKQVRLVGTKTWTDAGNNKHMSAAEIRLRKTAEPAEPELTEISVADGSVQTAYTAGETFNPSGLQLTLTYDDGSEKTVDYSDDTADDFTFEPTLSTALTTDMEKVTIGYAGFTADVAITVAPKTEFTVIVDNEVLGTDYHYNDAVTVTAPEAQDGQKFAGWEVDGSIVSTAKKYTFYVSNDIEVTSKFVDADETVTQEASALLTNAFATKRESDGKSDIKFVAQLVIPEGYKLVNAGLSWSTKPDAELSLDNKALKPTCITAISTSNQFSVTIKGLPQGKFIRGKVFAKVIDDKGAEKVIYSATESKVSAL